MPSIKVIVCDSDNIMTTHILSFFFGKVGIDIMVTFDVSLIK
jgi:hypothetical protein